MQYAAYAISTWAILTICGLPLAIVLLPRQLRRLAIPFAPLFGYCYLVFAGFHLFRSNIGGSDVFAPYLALVPALALAVLAWHGRASIGALFTRQAMLMTGMAWLSFAVLSSFYLLAGGRAVAIMFTNFDLIELASLARYMQEFAYDTKIGYMGVSENFRFQADVIWFGPSMIVAIISSLTGSEPFRLQSLVMTMVASQACAFVYAIARDSLSFNRATSMVIGVLYAFSPVAAYVVWQSFGGQMIATAIVLALIYLVTNAQTLAPQLRLQLAYVPSIVLLLSGLFVTYHFMVGVVLALLGVYLAVLALAERSWPRLWVGAAVLTVALVAALALNPSRVAAVMAMLDNLAHGSNGWFIPWLSPEIQLGFDASHLLGFKPFRLLGHKLVSLRIPGILVALGLAAAMVWTLARERDQPRRLAFVLGLAVPAFLVGLYFAVKEADAVGVLGSYRSYKFTSTFLALSLIALGLWFGAADLRARNWQAGLGAVLAASLVLVSALQLTTMLRRAGGKVHVPDDTLAQIRTLETMDFVGGINVMDDEWLNLFWTHYFTLRKPQAFQTFVYGGRAAPLLYPYRLQPKFPLLVAGDEPSPPTEGAKLPRASASGGKVAMGDIFVVPGASDCVERTEITSRLELCKPPEAAMAMTPGLGWWEREPWGRWSGANGRDAEIFIDTPIERSVRLRAEYGQLPAGRALSLSVNGANVPVESTATGLVSAPFDLKPGRNVVRFTANFDPEPPEGEKRALGVAWRRVSIESPQASAATAVTGQ